MDGDDTDAAEDPSYDPEGCSTNTEEDESDDKESGPSISGKKSLKSTAKGKSSKRKVTDKVMIPTQNHQHLPQSP